MTVLRIAMWSGPRNLSTALMRSFENRAEVFVTGTMGGVTPVLAVDGRTIGAGRPGPFLTKLSGAYLDRTATEGTPVT